MTRAQRFGLLSLAVGVAVIAYTQRGQRPARLPPLPGRDYSGRSGFPRGVEASRGLAANAAIPNDVRIPDPLRPLAS